MRVLSKNITLLLFCFCSLAHSDLTIYRLTYDSDLHGGLVTWCVYHVVDRWQLTVEGSGHQGVFHYELSEFSYTETDDGRYRVEFEELCSRPDMPLERPEDNLFRSLEVQVHKSCGTSR